MKLINTLSLFMLITMAGYSQNNAPEINKKIFFIKGGIGTSWIIMPKVFLVNPADTSSAQILPATNSFTGYIGFQSAIPLGKHWLFLPEIDINYMAGEIRVDIFPNQQDNPSTFSQKLQAYTRIEVPLNFGVVSSDNFWVSFGPVIFFTLSDNKGFDAAVDEVALSDVNLNSDNPIGLRFRLAAYVIIGSKGYLDIKFDSDLKRNFFFADGVYNMKMSMQSITIGYGWRVGKDR